MTERLRVHTTVVGAGPAGAATALALVHQHSRWAKNVLVIDRAAFPRPKICGGGITRSGMEILAPFELGPPPASCPVDQIEVRLSDRAWTVTAPSVPFFSVFCRSEFDAWLVGQVRARGVSVFEREPMEQVHRTDAGGMVVRTPNLEIETELVVGADGASSTVRRHLGSPGVPLARLLDTVTLRSPSDHESRAVFDFGPLARGVQGYSWDFPALATGRPVTNRGIFDSRVGQSRRDLSLPELLRERLHSLGTPLDRPLSHPIRRWTGFAPIAQGRVLYAGDAAGVDPLVGEGISFALAYGAVAGAAIHHSRDRPDRSADVYRDLASSHSLLRQLRRRAHVANALYRPRPAVATAELIALGWLGTKLLRRHGATSR